MERAIAAPESPSLAVNLLLEDFELTSMTMAQDRRCVKHGILAMCAAIANAAPEKILIIQSPVSHLFCNGKENIVLCGCYHPVG